MKEIIQVASAHLVCPDHEKHMADWQARVAKEKPEDVMLSSFALAPLGVRRRREPLFCHECGKAMVVRTGSYERAVCGSCYEAADGSDACCPYCGEKL